MAETGSFAIVLPLLRVRFAGEYGGPFPTDTSNSHNGRTRSGRATVITATTPAAPPAGETFGVRYDKAIALPMPTITDGMIT